MKTEKTAIDKELSQLAAIVRMLEKMDDATKLRTFNYLKSKYSRSWPSDSSM